MDTIRRSVAANIIAGSILYVCISLFI